LLLWDFDDGNDGREKRIEKARRGKIDAACVYKEGRRGFERRGKQIFTVRRTKKKRQAKTKERKQNAIDTHTEGLCFVFLFYFFQRFAFMKKYMALNL
jgi:hypothetical protein